MRSANSSERASGPRRARGPSSPGGSTHQLAFRWVPCSLTRIDARPSKTSRTTAPFGRVRLGGCSTSTRPPCERCTSSLGPAKLNTRNFPRLVTPWSTDPTRDSGRGSKVLRAENPSASTRFSGAPARSSCSRSERACISGSSGTGVPLLDGAGEDALDEVALEGEEDYDGNDHRYERARRDDLDARAVGTHLLPDEDVQRRCLTCEDERDQQVVPRPDELEDQEGGDRRHTQGKHDAAEDLDLRGSVDARR